MNETRKFERRRLDSSLPYLALFFMVTVWLWPIGFRGLMPVGGDVSQFSMGLMGVLGRSLKAGRLPLWNDLWGFGFPGIAESQMGVFYPPHLLLYRWFSTETAYTLSLMAHTYGAAFGACWAARVLGISRWGAFLVGISWSMSGMFLIHLPHQWGYTTGSWMPRAVGLALQVARVARPLKSALLLAAVLCLQTLPGHFQFAFMTQFAVMAIAVWVLMERQGGWKGGLARSGLILFSLLLALPLAAIQLLPSAELAVSARSQRTVEYLGAFASSPIHLINYVAPNLFHGSPLWRSFAWDPFHAMPEEHRPYLGLLPLFLAFGAIRGYRRESSTRVLTILAITSLLLSLGPYLPGFSALVQLPGFSFFRAPARWSLLTLLALSLLAGRGFDGWIDWARPLRAQVRFALLSILSVGLVVAAVFTALAAYRAPELRAPFAWMMRLLPWSNDPPLARVVASAHEGSQDPLVISALMRKGIAPLAASRMTLAANVRPILLAELAPSLILLASMVALVPVLSRRKDLARVLFLFFATGDLLLFSGQKTLELAPMRPLTEQSSVLARLAAHPYGTRSIDPLRNLPMLAGVAPVSAYRTLDRPVLTQLVGLAGAATGGAVPEPYIKAAGRLVGASVRVYDPLEQAEPGLERLHDPALADWLYGQWARDNPDRVMFAIKDSPEPAARAWFLPGRTLADLNTDDPIQVLRVMQHALPLAFQSRDPEHFEVVFQAQTTGVLVVSVLHDSGWGVIDRADRAPVSSERVFGTPGAGAWQGVMVSKPGTHRLEWRFMLNPLGMRVSLVAWSFWLVLLVVSWFRGKPIPFPDA